MNSKAQGKFSTKIGFDGDLESIVSDVAPRPEATNITPAAASIASKVVNTRPLAGFSLYAPPDRPLQLYAAPDVRSPMIDHLGANSGYKVDRLATTADGQKWVHFSDWGSAQILFGSWVPLEQLVKQGGGKANL